MDNAKENSQPLKDLVQEFGYKELFKIIKEAPEKDKEYFIGLYTEMTLKEMRKKSIESSKQLMDSRFQLLLSQIPDKRQFLRDLEDMLRIIKIDLRDKTGKIKEFSWLIEEISKTRNDLN